VTCKGDQLTISADNSTLGSVLAAVHACIGVQFDIPAGVNESRTFGDSGPGPIREVLADLLSGTDLDYVISSSVADPQKIDSVLLMTRTKDKTNALPGATDRSLSPARRAWLQSRQNRAASAPADDENRQQADDASASAPATEDAPPAPATTDNASTNATPAVANDAPATTPEAPVPPAENAAPATTATNTNIPATASPSPSPDSSTADKISSMQQLFQQRRQMNQGQTNSPTPSPQ
jgi:hypothetical protein